MILLDLFKFIQILQGFHQCAIPYSENVWECVN